MWLAYLLAAFPVLVGAALWVRTKEVNWQEWAIGSAVGFMVAGIFHLIVVCSMTGDTQTLSGPVTHATHHPAWQAEWDEIQTETDSKGHVHTRIVHRSEYHPEHWSCQADFGRSQPTYYISKAKFDWILARFGGKLDITQPWKPNFDSGDKNEYVSRNRTGFIVPVHDTASFENRIQAAPSTFSYANVPDSVPVFKYPESGDPFRSNRLVGMASSDFSIAALDRLNAELGPTKKVNLIIVGFPPDMGSGIAQQQESKWIGGKKNDLVVCYGSLGRGKAASWAYCFGWTESALVKRNLETLFVTGKVGDDMMPDIREEIWKNYSLKDWKKFDYITIEPPGWAIIVLVVVMVASQAGWWIFACRNDICKD